MFALDEGKAGHVLVAPADEHPRRDDMPIRLAHKVQERARKRHAIADLSWIDTASLADTAFLPFGSVVSSFVRGRPVRVAHSIPV